MIELLAPSFTKNVPMIEVMTQMPPISSGSSIMLMRDLAVEEDRGENHGRDHGHRVGLEEVGGHAGAVADIVADVVGDRGGVARIVLRNARFDLADEVAADVGALGEDAAAETGEDRDQRGAEAERDQRVDDFAALGVEGERTRQQPEIDATPRSARPATSSPVMAPERKAMARPAASDCEEACAVRTLARTDTSMPMKPAVPDRIAPIAKPNAAKAESRYQASDEDDDPDDGDRRVLAGEIGGRAFADGGGNLLHAGIAGIGGEHGLDGPYRVDDAENAARDNEIERKHF